MEVQGANEMKSSKTMKIWKGEEDWFEDNPFVFAWRAISGWKGRAMKPEAGNERLRLTSYTYLRNL